MEKFRWMLVLTNMLVQEGGLEKGVEDCGVLVGGRGVDASLRGMSQYCVYMDIKEPDGF